MHYEERWAEIDIVENTTHVDRINADTWIINDLSIDREVIRDVINVRLENGWRITSRGDLFTSRNKPASREKSWNGRQRVQYPVNGKTRWVYLDVLMLETFDVERPSPSHVPWHRDNDFTNNDITNLSWLVLSRRKNDVQESNA